MESGRLAQLMQLQDRRIAWTLVAEIGPDVQAFPSPAHMASWVGVCPGNNESAGKRKSGKSRKGNRWARRALCEAAWVAAKAKKSSLALIGRGIVRWFVVPEGPRTQRTEGLITKRTPFYEHKGDDHERQYHDKVPYHCGSDRSRSGRSAYSEGGPEGMLKRHPAGQLRIHRDRNNSPCWRPAAVCRAFRRGRQAELRWERRH